MLGAAHTTTAAALVLVLVPGCGEQRPRPPSERDAVPVVEGFADADGAFTTADRLRFSGGLRIDGVRVEPSPLSPGHALTVTLTAAGVIGEVVGRLSVVPPRVGSRQVALGGVDAPPPTVPPDPRTTTVELPIVDGERSATVVLPSPWHPRQALVTLELLGAGRRIEVTDGPHTEDGVAILALVPVDSQPTKVTAARATVQIDGVLDEDAWAGPGTTLVESRDGEPWTGDAGQVWFAWDDAHLFAAARIADRDVWATLSEQDSPLWNEEVFELFVFGVAKAERYLELQVSPRGVTFDARFSAYRKGDEAWDSAWQTAVVVDGTIDDRKDRDRGWTAELAVPWTEICEHTPVPCPPAPGRTFVINAFRFERPAQGPKVVGLALSPTRRPDFHDAGNAAVLELTP